MFGIYIFFFHYIYLFSNNLASDNSVMLVSILSFIILIKIVSNYSQYYAGIIGSGLQYVRYNSIRILSIKVHVNAEC